MIDCPLCDSQLLIGFRHIDFAFIICRECFSVIKQLKQHKHYVRFSFLLSNVQKVAEIANNKLKLLVSEKEWTFGELFGKRIINKYFQTQKELNQDSGKYSLSTEGTQFGVQRNIQKKYSNTTTIVIESCQEAFQDMMVKFQPSKQTILKTTQSIKQSANTVKQKCFMLKSQYKTLVAQLPSFSSIKNGFKGFSKFF